MGFIRDSELISLMERTENFEQIYKVTCLFRYEPCVAIKRIVLHFHPQNIFNYKFQNYERPFPIVAQPSRLKYSFSQLRAFC